MSKKRTKSNLWGKVAEQIEAGQFPPVFVAADGKLALDGHGATLPSHIAAMYPAEIRAKAEAVAAERRAEEDRLAEEHRAQRQAAADREAEIRKSHGSKRVWRLAGFYIEELSLARYTLREIESWIDWDAYNLRHNHADVKIIGDVDGAEYCIDVSGHFANPCNDRVSTPSFDKLATRLRDYVQQRRENAAGNN